ncbi:Protein DCL [Hibiscus syriacus]|uniref:Protein DCL n=1 Tax=Hibiscus syriacus TaxID=106335 RepID=A0A6A2ZX10_HIBSY|nr:protein DCL homolog, chloroplastic-like [Hibiscus syriacus]KAE8695819.1 Protein DCL [Hibiscus syriacus]
MASILKPPPHFHRNSITTSVSSSPVTLSSPFFKTASLQLRFKALRTCSGGGQIESQDYGSDFLRKPSIVPAKDSGGILEEAEGSEIKRNRSEQIDWEDRILEDTVPLVGFVRMIIHSGKYGSGDRLSPEHERMILERLLPYHPEFEKKIGCGIDYITVGYHPDFVGSRCLFIVRKDGELVDFSYWKCIKGLIRKNYPLYADSFILRHFRWRRRGGPGG